MAQEKEPKALIDASAARALVDVDGLDAEAIARKAMGIAADICVYTNEKITVETL